MSLYEDMEDVAAQADERLGADARMASTFTEHPGEMDELHDSIARLVQGYSIEVLPKTARKVRSFANFLPEGTRVFIPFLPGARFKDCVPLATRLRQEGMEPVPHIAARRLKSRAELTETISRLRGEAGVTQMLVIAGDPKTAEGPFQDSLDVLETSELEKSGIETIFVGGQPEGIPDISTDKVEAALLRKLDHARTSSASMHLVTQFTLDIQALVAWRNRLAELGNTLPLHLGIAGPTSLTTLLKFAALTGASASLRAMRRYGAKLTQLASEAAPDTVIAHLAAGVSQTEEAETVRGGAIAGLHVYTFGGFVHSAEWMNAVRRGAFDLKPEGAGFSVR